MDTVNSVLSMTFDVTGSGLCLDETHVYANVDDPGYPPDKGAPGRFPFKHENLSTAECVQVDPYVIYEFDLECWQTAALAAHAVVCESMAEPDWQSFVALFEPELGQSTAVMMRMSRASSDGLLSAEILNSGELDGVHGAWYLDVDREMALRNVYMADPIPTYMLSASGEVEANPAAARLVEYPDNLDAVNWLINRDYSGKLSTCGGRYTAGDVQRAIWDLVEDDQSTADIGPWDQCRVDEILAEATSYGEGFTPGCDQSVAVILNPIQATGRSIARIGIAQVPFSDVLAPCELLLGQCETAWAQTLGGDLPFSRGNRWGSYFEYLCE
jgi:hypothetical protein